MGVYHWWRGGHMNIKINYMNISVEREAFIDCVRVKTAKLKAELLFYSYGSSASLLHKHTTQKSLYSLWQRTNARSVSFIISSWWKSDHALSTCLIPNFSASFPHRHSHGVSFTCNLSFIQSTAKLNFEHLPRYIFSQLLLNCWAIWMFLSIWLLISSVMILALCFANHPHK